ncbi:MAG: class I SAM-dependent methyltransferase [Acidimicrobiales bacterium]|jgi:tRNA (cmo5U34)-methyltransferase
MDDDPAGQYHFDPETYLDLVTSEMPAYFALQEATAEATTGVDTARILELGVGTGETAERVLAVHAVARLTGIDESAEMLDRARKRLPQADLRVGRLEDALPEGTYDLVVSALAVHHLDGDGKAELFMRVAERLRPGGRFVLADLVIPDDASDAITPIDDGDYDKPSRVEDQLRWLQAAGLQARVTWAHRDLAVIVADRP